MIFRPKWRATTTNWYHGVHFLTGRSSGLGALINNTTIFQQFSNYTEKSISTENVDLKYSRLCTAEGALLIVENIS
jgi:hypothetical protein